MTTDAVIACDIVSGTKQRLTVSWKKDNEPIKFDSRVGQTSESDLLIKDTNYNDRGNPLRMIQKYVHI